MDGAEKKKTLVMGASLKTNRYSNIAINRLTQAGHEVLAIGLREGMVAGVEIKRGLPAFNEVDTVTMYLGAQNQTPYYDYLLGLNPKRIIFNPGAENTELSTIARENGIEVDEACTLVMLSANTY